MKTTTLLINAAIMTAFVKAADDVQPAPPSIGANVPLAYFGPPPSSFDKRLVGPVQLLNAGKIDEDAGTITLPLYTGHYDDDTVHYYILTDTSDPSLAASLGLNHSPKLIYAQGAADEVELELFTNSITKRTGMVDFSPVLSITPGNETAFPPSAYTAGSIGDMNYTPIITISNAGGEVYNAPIIASGVPDTVDLDMYCDSIPDDMMTEARTYLHDKIVTICPSMQTVTLKLSAGFSFAKPVLYLSTDASAEVAAAMETATYSKKMSDISLGGDDSAFSAVERIFAMTNGFTNADIPMNAPNGTDNHPHRQGFNSALTDMMSPLNVLGGIPTVALDYSPLWDLNIGEWTQAALDGGIRTRVTEEFQILGLAELGWIEGPGGAAYGSSGILVNCPVAMRFL